MTGTRTLLSVVAVAAALAAGRSPAGDLYNTAAGPGAAAALPRPADVQSAVFAGRRSAPGIGYDSIAGIPAISRSLR